MKNPVVVNLTLLLIAFIWGLGFVPQRLGMEYLGPGAFNALRFMFGVLTLVPLLIFTKSIKVSALTDKITVGLGIVLGGLLFAGSLFQQISIQYTSLANVGFITGLYVIIVPLLGFFLGLRYTGIVWLGGIVAIFGLYLMTGASNEVSLKGDLLAMIGAVFWALHLLVLARKAGNHPQLVLAFYQFLFCAIFSLVFALYSESKILPDVIAGYLWPLVNGVIVVGIAFTLQVMVMEHAEPFAASLILALEAVFGALAGYLVFAEHLAWAALVGALMMLLGCLMAQLPGSEKDDLIGE
jgi:drug/metabolite transporter (DMT)-like permease